MRSTATVRESRDEPTRRDSILAEAAALFASRGIVATSVRDIAEATGMLAGSLYHHFESKDAIIDAILSRSLDKLLSSYREVRQSNTDPDACLASLIRASFRIMREEPAATMIYLKDREYLTQAPRFHYLEEGRAQVDSAWLEALHEGIDQGVFRDDLDPLVFYWYASSALWWVAAWQAASARTIDELTESYLAIFMDAARAKSARRDSLRRPSRYSRRAGGDGRRPS